MELTEPVVPIKRRHHTAPEYYLKAFRIPHERAFLWEYHRGTPFNPGRPGKDRNPVKRALSKASVKIDYYGPYEDSLEQLEAAALPVIDKLRTTRENTAGPLLTPPEKATLTDYIGLFMKRTTAREQRLPDIWKVVRPQELIKIEHAITLLMNHGDFTNARKLQEEKKKFERDEVPTELRQRSTIEPYNLVRQAINKLPWTFLRTSTPSLLTSDNPVQFPEREGLAHALAFLTFPISTTVTLFIGEDAVRDLFTLPLLTEDCDSAPLTKDQANILNHLTITAAHKYVYSHEASEETVRNFG